MCILTLNKNFLQKGKIDQVVKYFSTIFPPIGEISRYM